MNSDAILACFLSGASIADLASALGVPASTLEQLVRESMRPPAVRALVEESLRPLPPTTVPRAHPSSVQPGALATKRRAGRRTRTAVREAVLRAVPPEGATVTQLMTATRTTSRLLMKAVLLELQTSGQVRRAQHLFHLIAPARRASA
jgi:transposase-like protein